MNIEEFSKEALQDEQRSMGLPTLVIIASFCIGVAGLVWWGLG